MKRTVDEKLAYNRQRKDMFSIGYCLGVEMYREYAKYDARGKTAVKNLIATANEGARSGEQWDKGVMCGVRDAANERKTRKGK